MRFIDQMSREISIPKPPQRIISLVPSQTELLFDLGLANKIVGVTKFCTHPVNKVKGKPIIGGTKNFQLDIIDQLQPDLIIGNKEENYKEGIEALQQKYLIWMSNMVTLEDAFTMMRSLGEITQTETQATQIIQNIKTGFGNLPAYPAIPTAYFIWKAPYMSVGHDTFIHQMMQYAGFQNVFGNLTRYPVIEPNVLQTANPKLILLSSEPYPFKEKHIQEFREICPGAEVKLVDGELFSWYGSRLQYAATYFTRLRRELAAIG